MRKASLAEQEIRSAAIAWARKNMPSARIVHELNTNGQGSCRADLAFIEKNYLVLVELKSEKDTTKRLSKQINDFHTCSHELVVIAHSKHWQECNKIAHQQFGYRSNIKVWEYPTPDIKRWQIKSRWTQSPVLEPHAAKFLELLWRSELMAEADLSNTQLPKRPNRKQLIQALAWNLRGNEICKAVCRQLRERPFDEGDDPVGEIEHPGP